VAFRRLSEIRRSLPDVYWVVWVGTLINRMGGMVMPLLTFYLTQQRGLSVGRAGLIVSLFGAGAVVAALVGGVLADRLGRRATLLLSLVAGGALMASLGFVRDPWWIAANTFALGVAGELYRPAVLAFVGDVVPPENRLRAFGYLYWVINLSFAAASLLGGFLSRWSYTALFVGDAVTMLGYAVLVAWKLPETRPPPSAHPDARRPVRLLDVLTDRTFMTFWALSFAHAMLFFQSAVPLSGLMASQGFDQAAFGAVMAVNGVLIVFVQPAMTSVVARFSSARVLAVAAFITGIGFALHGLTALIAVHVLAVVVWTMGEIMAAPVNSTTVANMAAAEARGRYQGVFGMSWGLASCLGPLAGAGLLDDAGTGAWWGSCLTVGVVASAGYVATAAGRRARGA
jgi:MFS family permease